MDRYIVNNEQIEKLKSEERFNFIYFKNDRCSVCDSLLPQLEMKLATWGEKVYVVDCFEYPDIAAQNLILSVPALKVYFAGQEVISMIRFVDLAKLETDYFRIKEIME